MEHLNTLQLFITIHTTRDYLSLFAAFRHYPQARKEAAGWGGGGGGAMGASAPPSHKPKKSAYCEKYI